MFSFNIYVFSFTNLYLGTVIILQFLAVFTIYHICGGLAYKLVFNSNIFMQFLGIIALLCQLGVLL